MLKISPHGQFKQNGMLQNNIWTALSQANIGANLQHYNPLIDDKIKELFSIPDTWKLTAQMPFGSIEAHPNEKYIEDISTRLKSIKKQNKIIVMFE